MRPESSVSSARVGDMTWSGDRKRGVRVVTGSGVGVGEDGENGVNEMCERVRRSNKRKTDEKNKGALRQNIQRDVIKSNIKENRCRVRNTVLIDNWSKPVLPPFKKYYLNGV